MSVFKWKNNKLRYYQGWVYYQDKPVIVYIRTVYIMVLKHPSLKSTHGFVIFKHVFSIYSNCTTQNINCEYYDIVRDKSLWAWFITANKHPFSWYCSNEHQCLKTSTFIVKLRWVNYQVVNMKCLVHQ